MKRTLFLLYGVVSYFIFFGTILYAIGFVGNLIVPKTIDGIPEVGLLQALLINAGLLTLFAVQHSVMARPAFKKWWTKMIPTEIERSTYVLFSSLCLLLLFWKWEPLGGIVWTVEDGLLTGILYALFGLGWTLLFASSFLINHFDLFGLRQVWLNFRKKPYTAIPFNLPLFYKYVRHPLYLGFVIAFWSTPTMTVTHLIFSIACTGYILAGIQFEERDLISHFGDKYRAYKESVPMLIPSISKQKNSKKRSQIEVLQGDVVKS
jgi:protein-S-isoprenylcysteine O-methyltransferase Ste14